MASNPEQRRERPADPPPGAHLTQRATAPDEDRGGGDPVCWAFMVCAECGAVESEGHLATCSLADPSVSQLRPSPS